MTSRSAASDRSRRTTLHQPRSRSHLLRSLSIPPSNTTSTRRPQSSTRAGSTRPRSPYSKRDSRTNRNDRHVRRDRCRCPSSRPLLHPRRFPFLCAMRLRSPRQCLQREEGTLNVVSPCPTNSSDPTFTTLIQTHRSLNLVTSSSRNSATSLPPMLNDDDQVVKTEDETRTKSGG